MTKETFEFPSELQTSAALLFEGTYFCSGKPSKALCHKGGNEVPTVCFISEHKRKKTVCVTNIVPDNTANTDNEAEIHFHYFTLDVTRGHSSWQANTDFRITGAVWGRTASN